MAKRGPEAQACCPSVVAAPLEEDEAVVLSKAFAALADPARLRLLSLVAAASEVCACELVERLGRSQPTVSHHLKVLFEAGLVTGRSGARGSGTPSCPNGSRPCGRRSVSRRASSDRGGELWFRYFELGGMSTALELEAYLYGALTPPPMAATS